MSPTIDIVSNSALWDVPAAEDAVRRAVEAALASSGAAGAEVSVVLTDDKEIQALNRQWRGQDNPTNVLSFPAAESPGEGARFLGDIVLAFETVRREAELEAKPFPHHLAHLAVHGTLHLLGLDHEDDSEAELMERREREILAGLGIPDPYDAASSKRTELA